MGNHDIQQKVLFVDAASGFYRIARSPLDAFQGPVDLGLHLAGKFNSLNIGVGLLAGSIFPGSNRLILTGFSPCWGGFFVSSMGGAGLVFDNLGVNMVAVVGRAPSVHPGPEPRTRRGDRGAARSGGCVPDLDGRTRRCLLPHGPCLWTVRGLVHDRPSGVGRRPGRTGHRYGRHRVRAHQSRETDIHRYLGRPGCFGSKMLQQHGLAAIIYGGTFVDEDFRDRKVADQWFQDPYSKKLGAKDLEATVKYRYDPKFETGVTFGVKYATMGGRLLAFNYPTFTSATRSHTGSLQYFGDYPKYWNHPLCPCLPRCRQQSNKVQSQHALARSSDGIVGLARTFLYWNQVEREVGALSSSREGCRRVGREIKRYATVDCGSDTGRAWVCELSFVPGRESRERIQRRQR
jgi:hypothetical protein